jgi:hypothetical protein
VSGAERNDQPPVGETYRPRRSVLYMPGANERALEKARALPADALILDLEDAVAPAEKPRARELVCEAVRGGGYGARRLIVRINGLATEWGEADLAAAVPCLRGYSLAGISKALKRLAVRLKRGRGHSPQVNTWSRHAAGT